jgi:hypothetical protein
MAGVISVSVLIIALGVRKGVEGGVQETVHDEHKERSSRTTTSRQSGR